MLAFIAEEAQPTPAQGEFIAEVQDWAQGQYTSSFRDAADLQAKVTQSLHRYVLTQAATPIDENELAQQARALVPARTYTGRPLLAVAVAAGPAQQVIRPAELESEQLRRYLQEEAHAGPDAVLSHSYGTDVSIRGDAIILQQRDSGARVTLSETGGVAQPATTERRLAAGHTVDHRRRGRRARHAGSAVRGAGAGACGSAPADQPRRVSRCPARSR